MVRHTVALPNGVARELPHGHEEEARLAGPPGALRRPLEQVRHRHLAQPLVVSLATQLVEVGAALAHPGEVEGRVLVDVEGWYGLPIQQAAAAAATRLGHHYRKAVQRSQAA